MSKFSAGAQGLGYLFQIRFALHKLLSVPSETDLFIEGLDDISFESHGTPIELIQTKHHATVASLTDSSTDLWKTLRVWSHHLKSGKIDPSAIALTLVTNGTAADGSVAYLLGVEPAQRNVSKAIEILDSISVKSSNKLLENSFKQYNALSQEEKAQLLSATVVLTRSDDISTVVINIKNQIRWATRPEYLDEFFERLEGWWFARAVQSIKENKLISGKELGMQIYDLSEEYRQDSLPIHDFLDQLPNVEEVESSDRGFIEQLNLIKVGTTRLTKAVSDYYRAFSQRSKWLRGGHLHIGEISQYEEKLIDEWQRIFEAIKDELPKDCQQDLLEKAGRDVFNRIDTSLQLHIRPRATDSFIMRGTYHILSNAGHVGWHPYFREKLKHIFENAMESSLGGKNEQNP